MVEWSYRSRNFTQSISLIGCVELVMACLPGWSPINLLQFHIHSLFNKSHSFVFLINQSKRNEMRVELSWLEWKPITHHRGIWLISSINKAGSQPINNQLHLIHQQFHFFFNKEIPLLISWIPLIYWFMKLTAALSSFQR